MSGLQPKGGHSISRNSAENALNRTPQFDLLIFVFECQLIMCYFIIFT